MAKYKLNGQPIKNPTSFNMEFFTLTKSARVATGAMTMDFIANKRKFNFQYEAIASKDLNPILEMLWHQVAETGNCFHILDYLEDGMWRSATVYAGAIPKSLHRESGSNWVWRNVGFSLIER